MTPQHPFGTSALGASSSKRKHQAGASLLEVLVALLVVSLGLLGMAGMSAATFSYNKTSQLRLTGLALVNDYADRARVNVYGFDLGSYAIDIDDETPVEPTLNPDLDTKVAANAVTAANNVATNDKYVFMTDVANRLPQGKAVVVSTPSANARDMDIWLLWQEAQAEAEDDDDITTLFGAGQENCPNDLSAADKLIYSCMYFKVGL